MTKFESDISGFLYVIKILTIVASLPAYILLLSLVTFITLPLYLFIQFKNTMHRTNNIINKNKPIFDVYAINRFKTSSFSVDSLD
jgi:hypothetical protein